MLKTVLFSLCFAFSFLSVFAQSVVPLVPGITVDSVMTVSGGVCRLAHDPISGHLWYATSDGKLFELTIPTSGPATETLRYTVADHGIPSLQGFAIHDSTMYLSGNDNSAGTTSIGYVKRGKLEAGGSRTWSTVATTVPYPLASPGGDHAFSNVSVDPTGQYIFANCGARTHLGEIRDNSGAWPGLREIPITTRLFRFDIEAAGIVLQNDSAWLSSSGYLYASGLRNPFDMEWNSAGELFACDNSGERDDPEELNWIREGHHYGFPWTMGGNSNPIQDTSYDVNSDPMVNHNSFGYTSGFFVPAPGFPPVPSSITFSEPVHNMGPDADFFREPTGGMNNASDLGSHITSFSPHRSPLGLVIDRDNKLGGVFQGAAFVTSFMPGGDSTGYSPMSPWGGPVVPLDPARDLLQLDLSYNATLDNYEMTVTRIAEGFWLPVDAVLLDSSLFVVESSSSPWLWQLHFPHAVGVSPSAGETSLEVFPNPSSDRIHVRWHSPQSGRVDIQVTDNMGRVCMTQAVEGKGGERNLSTLDVSALASGIYSVTVSAPLAAPVSRKIVME